MATSELGFKKQLTKEEKIEKKKERLAAIGIDFLACVLKCHCTINLYNFKMLHY